MKLEPRSAKELPKIYKFMSKIIILTCIIVFNIFYNIKMHQLLNVMYLVTAINAVSSYIRTYVHLSPCNSTSQFSFISFGFP